MKMRLCTFSFGVIVAALASAAVPSHVQAQAPVATIRGQGTYQSDLGGDWRGEVSINAWQNADGTSDGMIIWTAVDFSGSGPSYSGYPWYMEVTNVEVVGNMAFVEAVVVYSPQFPEDQGLVYPFWIIDNGNGGSDAPDELAIGHPLNLAPIENGNLVVQ